MTPAPLPIFGNFIALFSRKFVNIDSQPLNTWHHSREKREPRNLVPAFFWTKLRKILKIQKNTPIVSFCFEKIWKIFSLCIEKKLFPTMHDSCSMTPVWFRSYKMMAFVWASWSAWAWMYMELFAFGHDQNNNEVPPCLILMGLGSTVGLAAACFRILSPPTCLLCLWWLSLVSHLLAVTPNTKQGVKTLPQYHTCTVALYKTWNKLTKLSRCNS